VAKFAYKIYTAFLTEEHAKFSAAFYRGKFRWDFELLTNWYFFCSYFYIEEKMWQRVRGQMTLLDERRRNGKMWEDWTDRLSRDVGKKLPLLVA
jgi:hypothetical protein